MLPDVTQTPKTSFYPQEKPLEIIHNISDQLSKLLIEANEEDKARISELIINHVFTKLPGGDPLSPINNLAKLLILKLKKIDSDTCSVVETLQSGGIFLSLRPPPALEIDIVFNNKTFIQMQVRIVKLCKEMENLRKKILEDKLKMQNNEIYWPDACFADHFVTCEQFNGKIYTERTKISNLTDLINNKIHEMITYNDQWTKYLTQLYASIAHQHDLLADKKNSGRETISSKLLPKCLNYYGEVSIKIPSPTNIFDRYDPENYQIAESGGLLDHTNKSDFITQYEKNYLKIFEFVRLTTSHLCVTAGTRLALIDPSPLASTLKSRAELLSQQYKPLHDGCLDIFNQLNAMTGQLKKVQKELIQWVDSKNIELSKFRNDLTAALKELEVETNKPEGT